MEYIIYTDDKQYLAKTAVPLVFTDNIAKAFSFANLRAGQSFITFLRNQGLETASFHLGQKPPK